MDHFTIRDIESLCGIKAHTLRIWEQRYNLFVPKRKESRHRIYDNDDLKELLRIAFLYHNGHKISSIAALSPDEIRNMVKSSCIKDDNHESFVQQLIAAGIEFDKEKFEKIVNCLVLRLGVEKAISHVFYPFLERIGMLWLTNNVIPAQEHFVSHIIRKKIIVATDGLETPPAKNPVIAIVGIPGEQHELPLLVANYHFRKRGNNTVYLGLNVSAGCLQEYIDDHRVDFLYSHVITHLSNESLENYIFSLCRDHPEKTVIVSGPAFRAFENSPANLRFFQSQADLVAFAKEKGETILAAHNS